MIGVITMNHHFKKKFGQNFITDTKIIDKIIDMAAIENDSLIIEIGPGSGMLTKAISKKANHVLAYEIDKDLREFLTNNLSDCINVDIIWDDFLKRDIIMDIKKYDYKHLYVIANLPYYITTPIITKFINDDIKIDKMVIMIQKEVANRLLAEPSSKEYGSLTVFLNYHFNLKKLFDVSRNVFIPKPNVDSCIVELKAKDNKVNVTNENLFYSLVRDSFKYKRKTLKNNLSNYDLVKVESILNKYGKDLTVRAEQLSLEIFADISNNL